MDTAFADPLDQEWEPEEEEAADSEDSEEVDLAPEADADEVVEDSFDDVDNGTVN